MIFGRLEPSGQLVGQIQVDPLSTGSDDPLAFAYGFSLGWRGEPLDCGVDHDELADEYVRGHGEGVKANETGKLPDYATVV